LYPQDYELMIELYRWIRWLPLEIVIILAIIRAHKTWKPDTGDKRDLLRVELLDIVAPILDRIAEFIV